MHAKVVNTNPTNYIFLRAAINTLSIEHSPFFQNLKNWAGMPTIIFSLPQEEEKMKQGDFFVADLSTRLSF